MSLAFLRGVLVWYLLSLNLVAQAQSTGVAAQTQSQKSAPLTSLQRQGLKMLQAAEAEAKTLPAPMRAYLLLEIASSYSAIIPAKERNLRLQAFQSTLSIEDDDDNKEFIQELILRELLNNSKADLEKALPKALPKLRNEYTAELSREYARAKRYDRALELLHQVAAEGEFPYQAAATLMLQLPEDRASERQEIFNEALAGYESAAGPEHGRFEDMATLVIRFWDKLPPALVLEATDRILDRAKKETEAGPARQFNFGSLNGAAAFASIYELRLFELLPVMQSLDESKAEQLLQENPRTKSVLERYPRGMQSLDTGLTGTPGRKREHSDISTISNGPIPEYDPDWPRRHAEFEKQTRAVYELARRDPKQAIRLGLALPGHAETRAQTLITVARLIGERDSSTAKAAVKEATNLSLSFDAVFRFDILKDAADVYLDLKDQDAALKTIADGNRFAEELYAKDTNLSNPNLALKAQWPSTNVWRQFVGLATRISPDEATKLIDEVPDSEIHAFLRVALASSLMGQEPGTVPSIRRNQEHEIVEFW